ncbi:hypothetical protein [Helicobacter heilmannii]|nr:hypothetical protein [Helicobacter heilmannii]
MLICIITLGYQEIYLAGIDFYSTGLGNFYKDQSRFLVWKKPHPRPRARQTSDWNC